MAEQIFNINFVSEVEKYPCLYNYKLKEYSKKDITEKAWTAVGNAVNLTATQAKDKWKNIRSVFVRNLKPLPSGSSKKKKYYLTDAMQFAIPYVKISGCTSGSLPNPEEQEDHDGGLQENNEVASPAPSTSPPRDTPSPPVQIERPSTPLSESRSSVSSNQTFRRNKKRASETDELFNQYIKSKMLKKKDEEDTTNNSANKMFLLGLLPDMNCMTPNQCRTFKLQVLDLMDGMLNVPSSSATQTPAQINTPSTSSAS